MNRICNRCGAPIGYDFRSARGEKQFFLCSTCGEYNREHHKAAYASWLGTLVEILLIFGVTALVFLILFRYVL